MLTEFWNLIFLLVFLLVFIRLCLNLFITFWYLIKCDNCSEFGDRTNFLWRILFRIFVILDTQVPLQL